MLWIVYFLKPERQSRNWLSSLFLLRPKSLHSAKFLTCLRWFWEALLTRLTVDFKASILVFINKKKVINSIILTVILKSNDFVFQKG